MPLIPNSNNEVICAFPCQFKIGQVVTGIIDSKGESRVMSVRIARVATEEEYKEYCRLTNSTSYISKYYPYYFAIYVD